MALWRLARHESYLEAAAMVVALAPMKVVLLRK
jgi:hypothetical protein